MFGVDVIFEIQDRDGEDETGNVVDQSSARPILQPMILEVQWAPDCAQAVRMIPEFWDEILSALYLSDKGNIVEI